MAIILGIDPGSRITGYSVIQIENQQPVALSYGTIVTGNGEMDDRLQKIFSQLSAVIHEFKPQQAAIEQVFMHKNAQSALKLGQARGAAIVAAAQAGLSVHEYSAKQIKQAVVGYGAAAKAQVQHMISILFKLPKLPAEDAADALAVALCHSNRHAMQQKIDRALRKTP